jgi:glycosyltransferase involved in cell wall biosynthesis
MIFPKVSIITPSFNQGQFIEETILSVLNQNYKNIEYILVDGGSNDKTMDVVEKYRDKIDVVIHEKDKGQTDAINKGFRLATGSLIGWINSDDILYPDCIEKIVALANQNKKGSIYYCSKLDRIDSEGKFLEQVNRKITNKNYLLHRDYSIIQQGSFYDTERVRDVNYLDEEIHYCMDLDLWLKLLDKGPIYSFNKKPLAASRMWEDTKTATGAYHFMNDIEKILFKHGMNRICKNYMKLNWRKFKSMVNQNYLKPILK